jgi:hypothetical protein
MKLIPATGEEFMGIRLMTYIPDDFIIWGIENIMYGNRQLNRTQAGGQVPSILGHHINNFFSYFSCQDRKLGPGKRF